MGLFDKKKKGRDDFESPIEQIAMSGAHPSGFADDHGLDADDAQTVDLGSAPGLMASIELERSKQIAPHASYGIEDAIALMRALPSENIELVVQVVKHTLESARIHIGHIIEDAAAKQQRIEARIKVLRDAITELEHEIDTRRAEIGLLDTEHRETTRVKERLVLAEKLTQAARADTAADALAAGGAGPSPASRAADGAAVPGSAAVHARARSHSSSPPLAPSSPPSPQTGSAIPVSTPGAAGTPNHANQASGNQMAPSPVGPPGSYPGKTAPNPVASKK